MKKFFSIIFLLALVLTSTSCSELSSAGSGEINTEIRDYCKTLEEAYNQGKSGDILEKEKDIEKSIDTFIVNDELTLWAAEKEGKTLMIAPMLTGDGGYYFSGRETDYYLPHITHECDDIDFWAKYILKDKSLLKLTVFKGKEQSVKGADKVFNFKIDNSFYTLAYKIEKL